MNMELCVNGFKIIANYTPQEVEEIFIPLILRLNKLHFKSGKRVIAFISAPPGAGKTTLSLFLEKLAPKVITTSFQSLSLDGFHLHNEVLEKTRTVINGEDVLLFDIKGMPETFDVVKFASYVKKLKSENIEWPEYDRKVHDVIENSIYVNSQIILIEGNWLLLDEDKWKNLINLCDYSIFIEADEIVLKNRLIDRKVRGGMSYVEAEEFYKRTDGKNVKRLMENHSNADLVLQLTKSGMILKKERG